MRNKVEILRCVCTDEEDIKNIKYIKDIFSDLEIEFMIEFKKIYELGTEQLYSFIDKLDKEGKDLDPYTIEYYVDALYNGPLASYTKEYSKGKLYFLETPDTMGKNGNRSKAPPNVPLYQNTEYPQGCTVDIYNKCPKFIQENILNSVKQVEEVFRSGTRHSMIHDNTLPIISKVPQLRYENEPLGYWNVLPNANYMVKDKYFYLAVNDVSEQIFEKVKDYLGDENFRLWADKKTYNPFDPDKNTSVSTNFKFEKQFEENEQTIYFNLDLMGDEFDSEARREKSTLPNDETYKLHTNEGQLKF